MAIHPQASAFNALFEGFKQAYGVYLVKKSDIDLSGRGKIKGTAASLVGNVTDELWSKHLNGKQGLGIIPINESNECRFGAIDVDDYDMDPAIMHQRVKKHGLPLVIARTKSGGTHLYCFTTDFIQASLMQARLSDFAATLGVGGSEIFPKQVELLVERGDAGSWINMPYFCGNECEDRYALNSDGLRIKTVEEFLRYAQEKMVDEETLSSYVMQNPEPLGPEAPPCINQLAHQGFPEGTRNNGLMHAGVFCILRNPDKWEQDLDDFNTKYMDPPVSSQEVLGVIKSLKKKEYRYMCNQQPMASYCNKNKCRACRWGIGPSTGMPSMGTLTKIDAVPPIWFIDVEGGGRLELGTEDLQQPLRFQKACMDQMNLMPPVMKRDNWSEIVSALLDKVNIVKVPEEATPRGMLAAYLEEFLNTKANHDEFRERDVLLMGQVWVNHDDGVLLFRMKDFVDFLTTKRFTDYKPNKIASYLKDIKAKHGFFNVKGKGINWYSLPIGNYIQTRPFSVPKKQNESPI